MAGITPASGYIESYWAAIVAVIIVLGAYGGVWLLKGKLRIDDALDVSSVHGITGIIGSLSIGFVASSAVNPQGPDGWFYGNPSQIYIQLGGVAMAIAWSSFWTLILIFAFRFSKFFKLTVEEEVEILGLDYYYHGDVAYDSLETPKELLNEEQQSILNANVNIQTNSNRSFAAEDDINRIPYEVRRTLSARNTSTVHV